MSEHDTAALHHELHAGAHILRTNYTPADDLGAPAMSAADWSRTQEWMRCLGAEELHHCERCKERWFDLKIDGDGICHRCRRRDKDEEKKPEEERTFLMSALNHMDPGDMPDLPPLSDIEQMLISPVHISMHVVHVKGAQYRYKGHVMTFLRDVPDVVTTLPRLPRHCNYILIKPKQTMVQGVEESTRQFRRSFTVERWKVQVRILSQYALLALRTNSQLTDLALAEFPSRPPYRLRRYPR